MMGMMKAVWTCVLAVIAGSVIAAEPEKPLKLGEKVTIEKYSQGKITIGGRLIRTDIIILPDGTVQHPWAMKKRHVLTPEDIPGLLEQKLDVLIIGRGKHGFVTVMPKLRKAAKDKGIELIMLKTGQAIEKLKELRKGEKRVGACFHIGC